MRTSLIFCLFSILLTTGVGLECEYCKSNSDSCTGMPHLCGPSENACLILTIETTNGQSPVVATYKGCTQAIYCSPSPMSFTFPSKRMRRASKCCRKNLCNSGAVTLPKLGIIPNGLKCPGCMSQDPRCTPTELIACNGWEFNCVYYDVSVELGGKIYNHVKRGCGTVHACMNKPQIFGVPGMYMEMYKATECTAAPKILKGVGK